MSGNSFGTVYSFTTFGESHGEALGVIIDGMPSGVKVDYDLLESELGRRKPGQNKFTTQRKEDDKVRILSGTFEGITTGTPIACIVENTNQRSKDYDNLAHVFRPGHADYTYQNKYGIRDYRGGGRSSGRETVSRVIAGAFAKMALNHYGISLSAGVVEIGGIKCNYNKWNPPFSSPLFMPEGDNTQVIEELIDSSRKHGDSLGGVIECHIEGVPVGLGEPVFNKIDALLSHAMFSLGAVKAFEVGSGIDAGKTKGSVNNDEMKIIDGKISYSSNNAGGILGGISNGNTIITRTHFKPTPSISISQNTITDKGENATLTIEGRHDPCICPRAVVVVEAMSASVILDMLLLNRCSRI